MEGQEFGPFSWDQMRAMAAEGRLVSESHVRREVDQRWFAAGKIPGLLPFKTGDESSVSVSAKAKTQAADASSMSVTTATVAATGAPPVVAKSRANGQPNGQANGQSHATRSGGATVSDSSSQKLKVAKPMQGKPKPAAASSLAEPTPPPPVAKGTAAKKNGQTPPPIPVPAVDASPLGIVMAPPVAAPATPGRGGGKAVGKSGAHRALGADDKGLSPLLVGGVLGGVALVLVAIGGGVVAWQQMTKKNADQLATASATKKTAEAKPAISDAELDAILGPITVPEPAKPVEPLPTEPAVAANARPGDAAPGAPEAVAVKSAPADPKVEAARKLIAAQTKWIPIEGVVIRGRDIQVEVAQIWLATDAKGSRIDPVLPSPGATAPAPRTAASAAASPGKFIFVDVRVSNTGAIPRKYTSWNSGGNITAILADATNEPLAFVPPAATPDVTRLTSLHIPAGQTIGDVLVFQAPPQPFESLKLLLAQSAFATAGRNFTLEVPVEFLFKQAEGLPPQTALAADDAAPGEGEGTPAPPAKPVDPNAPPSLEELTKSLEDEKKMLDKRNATDDAPPKPKPKG